MTAFQVWFDAELRATGRWRRVLRLFRWWLSKVYIPLVRYEIRGREILLPWDHTLPWTRKDIAPIVNDGLGILADTIREHCGHLSAIDVGCNVSDTWAFMNPQDGDHFELYDGLDRWVGLARRNTGLPVHKVMLSSKTQRVNREVVPHISTGIIATSQTSHATYTLDFVRAWWGLQQPINLLKTDCDGTDQSILMGAKSILKSGATLFFEYEPTAQKRNPDHVNIFPLLVDLGYLRWFWFDIYGYLMYEGEYAPRVFRQLHEYAEQDIARIGYDVAVFTDLELALKFRKRIRKYLGLK